MGDDKQQTDPDAKALSEWAPADTAKLATEGDTEAARDILRWFVEGVQLTSACDWPQQVPRAYAEYIAAAFRRILDEGVVADIALGVKSSKAGRRSGATTHDQVNLGAAYWLLVHRGRKPEDAKAFLNTLTGADRRTVERAAKACSSFGDDSLFDERTLMAFIAPALLSSLSSAS